jgi:hypothetical protein
MNTVTVMPSNQWVRSKTYYDFDRHLLYGSISPIEIGLEQASFFIFLYFFSSFEHVKSLLIMGPKNTKKRIIKV